jgi:hypothetical protein
MYHKILISIAFSCAAVGSLFLSSCKALKSQQPAASAKSDNRSLLTSNSALNALIAGKKPVIVAHGKSFNIASESTWRHLDYSIKSGAQVLELDIQVARPADGSDDYSRAPFVVFHDPTFHRVVHQYQTPPEKIAHFKQEAPELARSKEGQWDFNLFDRIARYKISEIKNALFIRDPHDGADYEFITLGEILKSIQKEGTFQIPEHTYRKDGQQRTAPAQTITLKNPLFYYLDAKDLVALARRSSNLGNWDWDRNSWSNEKLEEFTKKVMTGLNRELEEHQAFGKTFLCVRHPKEAELVNAVSPKMAVMVSSEEVTPDSDGQSFIQAYSKYSHVKAQFVEVKYLRHVLDPVVQQFAKRQGWQVFYNKILETDKSQFEGEYKDNLPLLVSRIVETEPDVFIQTNTVKELNSVLSSKGLQ